MLKETRNYICRGCLKSLPRVERYAKAFCSEACYQKRTKTCESHPAFEIAEVIFKNGTKHLRKVCIKCGSGGTEAFVSKPGKIQGLKVWVDGACFPNPGKGGWGVTTLNGQEFSGHEEKSTNQRMEMRAVIAALEQVEHDGPLEIITDSQFVISGATEWVTGWIENGWRTKSGTPVKNQDLWEELVSLLRKRPSYFKWVKGHSGDPGNDRADELATAASKADPELVTKLRKQWH